MRKIIHLDMDMFYAAVEIRDHPQLGHKPLVIGGSPNSRGVVSTANYEARKYGIHSAMSCSEAYRRCPHCTFIRPDFNKYREVSEKIRDIFRQYTDLVEPLSLDEAYLDVTKNKVRERSATRIAQEIKQKILSTTRLTASAGVAPNKFVAKIASDYRKPNGLWVVPPQDVIRFLEKLPVSKVSGIGKVTNRRLAELDIHTIGQLAQYPHSFLVEHFGKFGNYLYNIARGIDNRPVNPHRERQSYGKETTFVRDLVDMAEILPYLKSCAEKIFTEITGKELRAKTVTLKVKYHDFRTVTRQVTCPDIVRSHQQLFNVVESLLEKTQVGQKPIRLAGISLSGFDREENGEQQLCFPFVFEE